MKDRKNMETKRETKRKTITLDITEWYDSIKEISKREVRSIEEQCRYFIKKCVDAGGFDTTTITYQPNVSVSPLWIRSNTPDFTHDSNTVYCSATGENAASNVVDCECVSGVYQAK
jgi:hypothetical protein